MSVTWYIHGAADKWVHQLENAVGETGHNSIIIDLPPFSHELFDPVDGPKVLYGGTRLVEAAAKDPRWKDAVWYNAEKSRWSENYARWHRNTITRNPHLTTFRQIQFLPFDLGEYVFVRPDYDLKEFAGEMMSFGKLIEWRNRLFDITGEPGLTMDVDTPIIVAKPQEIGKEWRLFIVDGQIVDCSRYKWGGRASMERECPDRLIHYVDGLLRMYNPTPVFTLDIGEDKNSLFGIIEQNCFNSSGWYRVDLPLVVDAVSKYVESIS